MISGEKTIKLLSPAFFHQMYPHPLGSQGTTIQSQLDLIESLEDLQLKYPKLDITKIEQATITGGEMLFIPYGYWHQVTSNQISISINFFSGDADSARFLAKLFTPVIYPAFSYWILNLVEQNRQHGNKPLCNIERYSDEQLRDCLMHFFIHRYHHDLNEEQYETLIQLIRNYCADQDKKQNLPTLPAAEKPPRLKIRGLKWRIKGKIHK